MMYWALMKTLAVAIAIAFVAPLHGQLLEPELQPLAEKYKADLAAFNAQKATAMARAQQPYVSALDGAEKTATSAGNLDAVAAITTEREALKAGTMRAEFPEGLPKALQAPRKACLDAVTRVGAQVEPRRKAVATAYLQALASLQAKAAGKPGLAEQIAAEKEKLLANVDDEKGIETLLTSTEWIHRGQHRYKFTKNGRYQMGNIQGRFKTEGNSVSLNWDNGTRESLLFDPIARKFTHSNPGDFIPIRK